jgi:hypothetical protein
MEFFAYAMAGIFVIIWAVLLVKFMRVVSSSKKSDDQDEAQ